MRKLTHAALIVSAASAALPLASGTALADPAIDAFEASQQTAWNAHDAAAYTAAFDPNADIVTSLGWHWTGQAEAARNLGDGFKLVFAQAHLKLSDPQVRTLTPELALVTLTWSIEGARTIDGAQSVAEQHGFQTQLLQRSGAGWTVLSQQDTAAAAPLPASEQFPDRAAEAKAAFPTTPPPVRRCVVARGNGDCLIYGKAKPAPTH